MSLEADGKKMREGGHGLERWQDFSRNLHSVRHAQEQKLLHRCAAFPPWLSKRGRTQSERGGERSRDAVAVERGDAASTDSSKLYASLHVFPS